MTPLGDQRTIYADVDIILGSLMPPRQFFDGVNRKYAFTEDGLNEFLHGRDFDVLENTKVAPETTYFESPGHLAGRGGMAITKYASVKTALGDEPTVPEWTTHSTGDAGEGEAPKVQKTIPGDITAEAISNFEKAEEDIAALQKEIIKRQKTQEEAIKSLPQTGELSKALEAKKDIEKLRKEYLSGVEANLEKIKDKVIEFKGRTYKLQTKEEKAKTPVYRGVVGKLISLYPQIKSAVDTLWQEVRSITTVKSLVRESPTEEAKEWAIRKEGPKEPDVPLYQPPEKEGLSQNKMKKKASMIDGLEVIVQVLTEMDAILEAAGV
jgi:hypothetical protein